VKPKGERQTFSDHWLTREELHILVEWMQYMTVEQIAEFLRIYSMDPDEREAWAKGVTERELFWARKHAEETAEYDRRCYDAVRTQCGWPELSED
jgi:hypothetical protein